LEAKVAHVNGKPFSKPPGDFNVESFSKRAVELADGFAHGRPYSGR
jgi:hypothetical protein